MGTCCAVCLPAKVRDYAPNAQNGAVTVQIIENPEWRTIFRETDTRVREGEMQVRMIWPPCDICGAPAEFTATFWNKEPVNDGTG